MVHYPAAISSAFSLFCRSTSSMCIFLCRSSSSRFDNSAVLLRSTQLTHELPLSFLLTLRKPLLVVRVLLVRAASCIRTVASKLGITRLTRPKTPDGLLGVVVVLPHCVERHCGDPPRTCGDLFAIYSTQNGNEFRGSLSTYLSK